MPIAPGHQELLALLPVPDAGNVGEGPGGEIVMIVNVVLIVDNCGLGVCANRKIDFGFVFVLRVVHAARAGERKLRTTTTPTTTTTTTWQGHMLS